MRITHRWSWVSTLIIALDLLVLAVDVQTPLGTADYIFYFVPVAGSVFSPAPATPIWTALISTIFAIIGFHYSPPGANPLLSGVNRAFAVACLWAVAILVRMVIINRGIAQKQSWTQLGLSELGESLQGDFAVEELGRRALTALARYLNASVGALHIRALDGVIYERIATFAFSPAEDQNPSSFRPGEGIAGQAALENRVLSVNTLPPGYLRINSSLGASSPAAIMAAPLTAEGHVNSVIELGFTQKPNESVKELLQKASEQLGIALRSAQNKSKLAELLEESQRQAEELQVQQEELRAINEELEQQTRILKDSQTRLESQQAELEQTNQQLEEQSQQLELQKDSLDQRNQELLKTQSELSVKARELERASRYKSEFLANMSHELRTPLNSSLILAKLLADNKESNLTPEQVQYAETIYGSGNDLLNLINEILDLSKVEAGKMEVHPEIVSVPLLLSSLQKTFAPQAEQKGLQLTIRTETRAPARISTDRQRLEQILRNFLSNALKFTDKGSVTVRAETDANGIVFAVTDTGIGIPESQQSVIFEAFRQADGSTNRKYGGTGLGLSISREFAKLLGGKIQVESRPGAGSTFSLHLPIEYSAPTPAESTIAFAPMPASAAAAPARLSSSSSIEKNPTPPEQSNIPVFSFHDDRAVTAPPRRKILIIEDDESFAKVLFDLAHEMKFDALVSSSASEGIQLAKEFLPQAIVLDVRLPDHSGLAVLDILKSNPRTRHIPVHVVSAEDFSKTVLRMGAVGYMLKPVKREQLIEAFQDLESRMNRKIKRLLVVEDDPVQRESIVKLVSDTGVEVISVGTGQEALTQLQTEAFDCMVMDLSLPDISGYELLDRIEVEKESHPPVIVYTGRDLSRAEEERLRQRSGSIIIKGARSPERLLSETTLFLHRVESELPPERQKMLKDLRSREKTLEDRKILIVDDDARNIFALTSVLETQGAKISVARNGKEALERLEASPEIDLVLMDIMMPEMDGYEATRRIRAQGRFEKLPIIAVTAKAMKDDQERCIAAGANDYLPKPIDTEKLLSLIRVWMPQKRNY